MPWIPSFREIMRNKTRKRTKKFYDATKHRLHASWQQLLCSYSGEMHRAIFFVLLSLYVWKFCIIPAPLAPLPYSATIAQFSCVHVNVIRNALRLCNLFPTLHHLVAREKYIRRNEVCKKIVDCSGWAVRSCNYRTVCVIVRLH